MYKLNRKLHVSWQVGFVCAGFLAGTLLSLVPETAIFASVYWPLIALLIMALIFKKSRIWMLILAVIAGMLVGLWRGTIERVGMNDYEDFINHNVTLMGRVVEDPDVGSGNELRLKLNQIVIDDKELPGTIWVSILGHIGDIKRSDLVTINGKLKVGFGTYPVSMSFAKLEGTKRGSSDDIARDLRDAFGNELSNAISGPAKDLGMGILAGQKTALPYDISDAFRIAGLTHIVVASGYNLTILTRFARRLFFKISRLATLFGAGGMVFAFACVTGFSPSMTRAALVAGLSLLAWYFGRKFHPAVLLLFVAAITVAINPTYIWGDAGWFMSFFAFVGVIILAPLIKQYFWGTDKIKETTKTIKSKVKGFGTNVRQIVIETLSAQVFAAPVIALFMSQFAPYGLLANLLVLPFVPITMLLTFIAGIAGWLVPFVAPIIGWSAQKMLDYIIWVSQRVSELPNSSFAVDFVIWMFVGVIAIEIIIIIFLWRKTGFKFRDSNVVE